MTPTDLATLREKAEKAVSEIRAAADDWARIVDLPELQAAQQRTIDIILSLLSTLEAEQQQRQRLEQLVVWWRETHDAHCATGCDCQPPSALTTGGPEHGK